LATGISHILALHPHSLKDTPVPLGGLESHQVRILRTEVFNALSTSWALLRELSFRSQLCQIVFLWVSYCSFRSLGVFICVVGGRGGRLCGDDARWESGALPSPCSCLVAAVRATQFSLALQRGTQLPQRGSGTCPWSPGEHLCCEFVSVEGLNAVFLGLQRAAKGTVQRGFSPSRRQNPKMQNCGV